MSDLNLTMFKAYDIRTPSDRLTDELAERLARAEAVYFRDTLGAPGVVVAHDARLAGPRYLEIGAEAFAQAGLDVVVLPGVCSTSQFYFAAMRHPELAAVMFGASHNPARDTGQKILGPGVIPIAEGIGPEGGLDRIKALYIEGAACRAADVGSTWAYEPTPEYIAYSLRLAGVEPGMLSGMRVFHDYLHGAAGREMMLGFGAAGAELIPLHYEADGLFPLGDPNPVKQDVIAAGLARLKASGCVLGTFFDGDGDRIDIYRGDGTYVSSSFVYAGILPLIRRRFQGEGFGVYADLKSNPLAVIEMARTGVHVHVIRNGHSQIKNALAQDPMHFGAVEESAHFYEAFYLDGRRYCTENTLYIALLVANAWRENPGRFEELIEVQSRTAREREWGYKFPSDDQRAAALRAVEERFAELGAVAMTHMANGEALDATLMRRGIPFEVDAETRLEPGWLQVCHRVSQSEAHLARWEVVAETAEIAADAKREIEAITRRYGAGEEYQG